MATDPGDVTRVEDGYELRFERYFDQPVEEVWDAITDPEHLAEWLGTADVDLRPGARIRVDEAGIDGEVLAVEEPHVFSFKWDSREWGNGGPVRFELAAAPEKGTLLVFTHVIPVAALKNDRMRRLSAWTQRLALLAGALRERPQEYSIGAWQASHARYACTTVHA